MNCPKKFWPSCEFSPNLEPCPKFAEPNIYQFADHINEGKTVALSRQSDKELGMMKSLRRNSQSAQLNDQRIALASLPAVEVIRR